MASTSAPSAHPAARRREPASRRQAAQKPAAAASPRSAASRVLLWPGRGALAISTSAPRRRVAAAAWASIAAPARSDGPSRPDTLLSPPIRGRKPAGTSTTRAAGWVSARPTSCTVQP